MDLLVHGATLIIDASGTTVDCAARLDARLDHGASRSMVTPRRRAFVGHAVPEDVVIWAVGPTERDGLRIYHPWTPVFRGRVVDLGERGARLEGRIRVQLAVPVFTILWLILVAGWLSAGVPYLMGRLQQGTTIDPVTWVANLILPVAFGVVFVLLCWFGSRFYRQDRQMLEQFLRDALA